MLCVKHFNHHGAINELIIGLVGRVGNSEILTSDSEKRLDCKVRSDFLLRKKISEENLHAELHDVMSQSWLPTIIKIPHNVVTKGN